MTESHTPPGPTQESPAQAAPVPAVAPAPTRRRLALIVVLCTGFALILTIVLGLRWAITYPDRPLPGPSKAVSFTITKGTTFGRVLRRLRETGIVKRAFLFRLFANSSGMANKLRPGSYTIEPGLTPRQLLKLLVKGPPVVLKRVTIPEGKHMLQVAKLVADAGISTEAALVEKLYDRRFVRRLGIRADTLEGYLFPDTYRFRPDSAPELVWATLVKRSRAVLAQLKARHPSYMIRLRNRFRFDDHQIVLMASLVEKETGAARERPLIAGVFFNRLHFKHWKSRRLETDPTIIYGCTVPKRKSDACLQFKGRIRRIHLRDAENPYNTYKHAGLPPGPIANPGRAALMAVIRPTTSKYVFFVSKNDGTHHFSATREEHERMVDKYQRKRRPRPRRGPAAMTAP